MTCLNDSHIQALADGEGSVDAQRHARECAGCAVRVQARAALMASIAQAIDVPAALPGPLAQRVDEIFRLKAEATGSQRGATRLLNTQSRGFRLRAEGRRGWIYSGLAVAAATIIAVLFIAPAVRKPGATVSASEILAKSATQLSATVASGVEILQYELVLDGVPKEMLPDQVDGTYKVWQAIDHNVPGRFRFASFASDGRMLTSISEDPLLKRRVAAFTSEGQPYRYELSLPANATNMSLPDMQRLHMEASITMMQASGNQLLETIDGPNGKLYRIEVPRVTGPGTNPVWDLTEARVLIDARDYNVTELAVRGTFLRQSYSMSYRLISHVLAASVQPDAFVVPSQPGEIVIAGEGTTVPTHDIVVLALRELTKLKKVQ
ncbi:MAG TPA: hypothetical protein VF921_12230 [Vicinamibacterales bacterium]